MNRTDELALELLDKIRTNTRPADDYFNPCNDVGLFIDHLFCRHMPAFTNARSQFNFKTGFEALFKSLRQNVHISESPWEATAGKMRYNGTIIHHFTYNIYTSLTSFGFPGDVQKYFRFNIKPSSEMNDFCVSEDCLRELRPIIYELSKFDQTARNYHHETAIDLIINIGSPSWNPDTIPRWLNVFQGKMIAILNGNFARPIQRIARKWYQRRLLAAQKISNFYFEYVMHPDHPYRKRMLERTKQLSIPK